MLDTRGGGRTVITLGFGDSLCPFLEFFGKGHIVEKAPRIVEFGVPGSL